MKHTYFFFPAIILCLVLNSCNLINPGEPTPAFIHIDAISLQTDPTIQGSNSSNITDAWVYIDNELVGCYELPATFPVLYDGSHDLTIKAGIKVNGISATRAPYPFFEEYKEIISLSKGSTITVKPVVKYTSSIDWASIEIWKEDFEDNDLSIDSLATSTTKMISYQATGPDDPLVFEGNRSGVAYIDVAHPLFEGVSSEPFILPHGDSPVFLEINYKSNHDFVVGIFAHVSGGSSSKVRVINVRASDSWNKIYVYMSPTVNLYGNANAYSVFFGLHNDSGVNGLYLALDNIKLVHN
ncbi:MAG: hypothetical protein K0Q95_1093 [Bacteroidota bacterium]|jgi:hypothetical protein|nr:hypothetical protein [Bacteroidota bacterium]